MADRPIMIQPAMTCPKHQRLFLGQVGIGPDGPWRSAIISLGITLFQGTTAKPNAYEAMGGNIERIGELGCLACFSPDVFGAAVDAWQRGGMAACKALGDSYVAGAAVQEKKEEK